MTIRLVSLLALLAVAAPLAAQEAADPAPAEPTQPAPAEPDAAGEAPAPTAPADEGAAPAAPGPSMGEAADQPATPAEPQVGEPYIREVFGDWALRCLREENEPDPCQLYQLLYDGEGNTVAEISMFPLPAGQGGDAVAGATIVAPLETLLPEGLRLSVDGSAERRYPFTFCTRAGCVARVGFTAAEVDQFRRGNAARLRIVPAAAPDQTVDLRISLTGFTAGYNTTTAAAQPPQ
jgi:invasion protein IalB